MPLVNQIPAGEFKAKCLKIMDEVKASGRTVIVTKHGVPVAKLVPIEAVSPEKFGLAKNSIQISGDIISSIDEKWDAEQ